MSTLTDQRAAREAATKTKPKKKSTAKRDEHGRFIKKHDPDLDTPSL